MKLDINTAISLILALPAHRSGNQGHQKLGEKALDFLIEYKDLGDDNEKAFNRDMISAVFSAVRAFSVERDALSGRWKTIDDIKIKRENLIRGLSKVSVFENDNYWAKLIAAIPAIGVIINTIYLKFNFTWWQYVLVGILPSIFLDIFMRIFIFIVEAHYDRKLNSSKNDDWGKISLEKYKQIIGCFIEECIKIYKKHDPNLTTIDEYDITSNDRIEKMKKDLVNIHFYLTGK